ncbi:unnamed protein product, partial [Trichogramma brassicae]
MKDDAGPRTSRCESMCHSPPGESADRDEREFIKMSVGPAGARSIGARAFLAL